MQLLNRDTTIVITIVICKGVEAFVRRCRDGKRYGEHTAPRESSRYTGASNEVYIEAVSGECFEVVVQPTEEFDFTGCGAVQARCVIDRCEPWLGCTTGRETRASYKRRSPEKRKIVFGREAKWRDDKWVEAQAAFAELQLGM